MRTPRTLLVVAALALTATACADGGESAGSPSDPAPAPAPTTTAPPATTAPAPASTAPGTSPGGGTLPVAPGTTTPVTTAAPPPATVPTLEQLAGVRVDLRRVADLDEPVDLVARPGDPTGLHVAERVGRVVRLDGEETTTVLDMEDRTEARGEQGLLGLTYSTDGSRLYLSYTDRSGDSVVDEYAMRPDGTADPASRRELLTIAQPYPNHNGGEILTGPDGLLYLGFGDGGAGGDPERYALNLGSRLGKILRIDPAPSGGQPFTIPADNPFAAGGGLPEIWSYGLRNPWRFSFDPATGDLWVADVGQNEVEEVSLAPAVDGAGRGTNFGWSAFEGTRRFNEDQPATGALPPVHEYEHGSLGCSVSGGEVYRGAAIPALQGAYLFADFCVPGVRAIPAGAGPWQDAVRLTDEGESIAGFGLGPDGELYALSLDGAVSRIEAA
jgi:glucose/arabinose dehydrogenase